jgi:hypothetical protein
MLKGGKDDVTFHKIMRHWQDGDRVLCLSGRPPQNRARDWGLSPMVADSNSMKSSLARADCVAF